MKFHYVFEFYNVYRYVFRFYSQFENFSIYTYRPFPNVLEPDTFLKLKSPSELRQAFEDVGVNVDDTDTKLYLSCGSGVTACILATALQECGRDPASTFVYDGSWVEWGGDPDTPINTKE